MLSHSARHLKCDEAKPSCSRCTLAGRECKGYEQSSSSPPSRLKIRQLKHRVAPEGVKTTPRDWQMFELFRTVTAHQVGGGVDLAFWSVDLLRAAHAYPAIWHACLALSATHEWMKLEAAAAVASSISSNYDFDMLSGDSLHTSSNAYAEQASEQYTFALAQYNASITHVLDITRQQQDLSYASKETLLMTSMLYAGICSMQNNPSQALVHIRNTVEIFGQWRFWELAADKPKKQQLGILNTTSLVRLVTMFYHQFRDLAADSDLGSLAFMKQRRRMSRSKKPFASPTEAYFEYRAIMNMEAVCPDCETLSLDRADELTPLPRGAASICAQHALSYWKTRFAGLQRARRRRSASLSSPPSASEKQDGQTMRLLTIFMDLFDHIAVWRDRESWPKLERKFHSAVDSAEQLLRQQAEDCHSSLLSPETTTLPIFSYSESVLEAITSIGILSRNRAVRQRVTALMDTWPRREGVCNSELMRLTIEAIMQKEEEVENWGEFLEMESCCACERGVYVCRMHKVEEVALSFPDERMVKVSLRSHEEVMMGVPASEFVHAL